MKKRLPVFFASAALLLLAAVLIYLWVAGTDDPPPDDADLRLPWDSNIPTELNAADFLLTATNMWWKRETYADSLDAILAGTQHDPKLEQTIVDLNELLFKVLERAVRCPRCQVPEIRDLSTPLPYLEEWRRIARLIRLRGALHLRRNQPEEALRDAMLSIRMGHRIENCHGTILHYLVGLSIKHMGLRSLETILDTADLTTNTLLRTAADLESLQANDEGLRNVLKQEYAVAGMIIDKLNRREIGLEALGIHSPRGLAAHLPMRYLLQPNRTRRRFAEYDRALIAAVGLPLKEARKRIPALDPPPSPREILLHPNGIGRILYASMLPGLDTLIERRSGEQLYVEAIRLRMLLKAYEKRHGTVPKTLAALVPDAPKTALPMDPYDGKPLRYLPEKRLLYSVGRNLVDDGGSTRPAASGPIGRTLTESQKRWLMEDIVFKF